MKKILLLSLLFAPTLAHAKPKPKSAQKGTAKAMGVVWRTDFDAALKEAQRLRKPIFLDLYTTWCGPCKILDKTTYRDPKFVRASRDWVMVKIDAQRNARNVQIAQQYDTGGYPAMWMLSSSGKRLSAISGYRTANMLLEEMRKAQGWVSAKNIASPRVG